MHKDIRKLVKQIESNGFSVVHGGKHLKVKNAAGATVAVISSTPGGGRWLQNTTAQLKKLGAL